MISYLSIELIFMVLFTHMRVILFDFCQTIIFHKNKSRKFFELLGIQKHRLNRKRLSEKFCMMLIFYSDEKPI
jgi:hypothetical protein